MFLEEDLGLESLKIYVPPYNQQTSEEFSRNNEYFNYEIKQQQKLPV